MNQTLRLFAGYPDTEPHLHEAVKAAQRLLRDAGLPVVADGYYGPLTASAVEQFQTVRGLAVDGIVGPRTWAALHGKPIPRGLVFETHYNSDDKSLHVVLRASAAYRGYIEGAAESHGLPVALLWGIGARESRWGMAWRPVGPDGTGDYIHRTPRPHRPGPLPPDGRGYGRGLMQIDWDAHEFARTGDWADAGSNINYGARVLAENLAAMRKWYSDDVQTIWRRAAAAYNCGAGNVRKAVQYGRDVDYYTSHRNYSVDVFALAGWFEDVGGFRP